MRRRRQFRPIIDSVKNSVVRLQAVTTSGDTSSIIAQAMDNPTTAVDQGVMKGGKVFRIWIELSYTLTGTVTDGVSTVMDIYMMLNPGSNLTPPQPGTQGTSNEKKYVFKTWRGLVGARSQGCNPFYWKGWIKIPKVYQRMGTDDQILIISRATGVAGVICIQAIYKYYK